MKGKLLEPNLYNNVPSICIKPGCGGSIFIPHDDGWQCFNCMKIVYKINEKAKSTEQIKRYTHNKQRAII